MEKKIVAMGETSALNTLQNFTLTSPIAPALINEAYKDCTSVQLCVKANAPKVSTLEKESKPACKVTLVAMLKNMADLTGCKNKLSDIQMDFIVNEIMTNYMFRSLTLADIRYVLHQAVCGAFGELYESINPPKVLSWFNQYLCERSNVYEDINIKEHYERRMRERCGASNDDEFIKALYNQKPKPTKETYQQERERLTAEAKRQQEALETLEAEGVNNDKKL